MTIQIEKVHNGYIITDGTQKNVYATFSEAVTRLGLIFDEIEETPLGSEI